VLYMGKNKIGESGRKALESAKHPCLTINYG